MQVAHFAEIVGRQKLKVGAGFKFYHFKCIDPDTVQLVGCEVTKEYTRGPRKGTPVYDGTPRTCFVVDAEMNAARERYRIETGNCDQCLGEGKTIAGFGVNRPTTYRECRACNGTGKAQVTK